MGVLMAIRTLLSSVVIAGLLTGTALAGPLKIRSQAMVEGETIRLGELVEGLDTQGEVALFGAPAPGARGTIRVERIIQAARELGIEGIDIPAFRAVSVYRPGRAVARAEMQEMVAKALAAKGATGTLEIVLDDHIQGHMVDQRRAGSLKVAHLGRDPRSGRFEARLATANDADVWTVTGSISESREIAVLANDIERSEPVQAKDIVFVKRPAGQVGADIVTDAADLVGMLPRRALRAGEPIRQADIAKPLLVDKNQLVTVTYAVKGLSLSMRGRAQAGGAKGETVRVQNPQSKRIIEGIVSGPALVTVTTPPLPPANLADAAQAVVR